MNAKMIGQNETAGQVTSEGEMVRNQLPSGSSLHHAVRRNHG